MNLQQAYLTVLSNEDFQRGMRTNDVFEVRVAMRDSRLSGWSVEEAEALMAYAAEVNLVH